MRGYVSSTIDQEAKISVKHDDLSYFVTLCVGDFRLDDITAQKAMEIAGQLQIFAAELAQLKEGSYPLNKAQLAVLNEPSIYNSELEEHKELMRLGLLWDLKGATLNGKGVKFLKRREEYLAKHAEGSVSSFLAVDDLDWSRVIEVYVQAYVDVDGCEAVLAQFYSVFAVLAPDYQEEQQQGTVLVSDHPSKDAAMEQVKQLCETHSISKHYFIEQEG